MKASDHIRSARLLSLAVMVTLWGCGGRADDRSGRPDTAHRAASPAPVSIDYKVVPVADGGVIAGRVVFRGRAPELPAFEITADHGACGTASANNRLEVGPDGGVAWAVVHLVGVREGVEMPQPGPLEMDQRGCQYTPHVLVAPLGATVTFINSDDIAHNVRVEDIGRETILLNRSQQRRGDRDPMVVTALGAVSVGCDYHPWMNAYVYGVDNPYHALTGPDGRFVIEGVPPGSYVLRMWLNGIRTQPKKDNQGRTIGYTFSDPIVQERKVEVASKAKVETSFEIAY